MEDLEYDFDGAGTEDDFVSVIVGIFHLVGIVFFFWYCCLPKRCRRCGRRESEPEPASADAPFIASAGQLQPKKRVLTTYVLWLSLGFLGAHHFYLGRVFHGVFAAWFVFDWGSDIFDLYRGAAGGDSQEASVKGQVGLCCNLC